MRFVEYQKKWLGVYWDDGTLAGEISQPRQIDGFIFDAKRCGSISTNQLRQIVERMEDLERGE